MYMYPLYLRRDGGSELFVEFNDDTQTHKNILLIFHFKKIEHG